MIVESNTLYSKKQMLLAKIIDVVIAIACGIGVCLIIAGTIVENNTLNVIGSVLAAFGVFDIVEVGGLIFTHKYFTLKIFGKLFKVQALDKPKDTQNEVLNHFFANEENTLICCAVLISGKKGSGKSQCTDYIINMALSNLNTKEKALKQNFIYIDCYNDTQNSSKIIQDFEIFKLNNSLIIIDNCNEADWVIIKNIIEIINHKNCSLLIIEEDSEMFRNKLSELSTQNAKNEVIIVPFEEEIKFENQSANALLQQDFSDFEKKIIIACALYCRFFNLFYLKNIVDVLKLKGKKKYACKKVLRSLVQNYLIKHFPMNTEYYKFSRECDLEYIIDSKLNNEELFDKTIDIFSTDIKFKNPEVLWLIMLYRSKNSVLQVEASQRRQLFIDAAKFSNFKKLLNALDNFTAKYNCKNDFLYEYGYLNYNLNDFVSALENYNKYFADDDCEKKLRFIEIFHTSDNAEIKKLIDRFLSELKNEKEPKRLFADYWETHIQNERGFFNINRMHQILNSLIAVEEKDDILHTHIERCFTDELRMYWITNSLTEKINADLLELFANLYKNDKKFKFYSDLYFNACFYHYIKLPNAFLENRFNELANLVETAECFYRHALNDNYGRIRSTATAKIKLAELQSLKEESKFDDLLVEIDKFRFDSEKKNASLHIAYAETVRAKVIATQKLCWQNYLVSDDIEKVMHSLQEANGIYKSFGNEYGTLRCEYLSLIISILKDNLKDCKKRIEQFLPITQNYELERKLCERLVKIRKPAYLDFYNSIKYYPIILQ
ncbi:MAG: hypothetical protein K2G44_02315 [Clostridia bacterium]|nr:hypothetical protein [Clostridia bacterium]